MRKRTSIITSLILGMLVILAFFIAVVLALWFNQYFDEQTTTSSTSSLMHFFLNINGLELFGFFVVAAILASLVVRYIASNIRENFKIFNQYFYDAMNNGKIIDEEKLNFKEFKSLSQLVNHTIRKSNESKKRLEFNEKYLQTVLDAQKNIVIVRSQGKMEKANKAFFDFIKVKDIDEFKENHRCISEFFVKEKDENYLTRMMDETSWVSYILMHPLESHKVKVRFDEQDTVFEVNAKVTEVEDIHKVVITFNNINELEEERKSFEIASSTDALTGVANRFKFDMILEQQIEMSKRYNHSFCLILFDIDNFKQVNDTYGHQVGDNILVELADLVKNSMRRSDTFARWGGEEFAIILPQSRLKTAVKIAEKLCLKISFHLFKDDMRITCSFGVTEYKKLYTMEDLLKKVDEKLYVAKERGKDQVIS
jgi:diguanylate cyclase (GGDEF)-like protein